MPKFVSIEEAVKLIPDGATVMFGGFMGCGSAHKFIDALSKSGVKDLTMICNDGSMPGGPMGEDYYGVAKLIHNKQVKKLIATHVGLNPEVATQSMQDGTLEVVLIPQGSLAEMIRADGAGLGHDFLRHIDRCRLLVHIVDVSGSEDRDPVDDFEKINEELRQYSPDLAARPMIVAANKADLLSPDSDNLERLKAHVEAQGYEFYVISAATTQGTRELMKTIAGKLAALPPVTIYEPEYVKPLAEAGDANDLRIERYDDLWVVSGQWLQKLLNDINFDDYESRMYFDRQLRKSGLFDRLEEQGIEDGDTVSIYDFEFDYTK